MGTYGVRVTRGPVIPANLTGTLPGLHPFIEKGTRNRRARALDGFDTPLLAANYQRFLPFTLEPR